MLSYIWSQRNKKKTNHEFREYLLKKIDQSISREAKLCLLRFFLLEAHSDKDIEHLIQGAQRIRLIIGLGWPGAVSLLPAVVEAAIWLRHTDLAAAGLATLRKIPAMSNTVRRLEATKAWRFSEETVVAKQLISPVMAKNAYLDYMYFYAIGKLTELYGYPEDALRNYKMSMRTMPPKYHELEDARGRCMQLLAEIGDRGSGNLGGADG